MWSSITQLTKTRRDSFHQQKQDVLSVSQHIYKIIEIIAPSLLHSIKSVSFDNDTKIVVVRVVDPLVLREFHAKKSRIYAALIEKRGDVVDVSFTVRL